MENGSVPAMITIRDLRWQSYNATCNKLFQDSISKYSTKLNISYNIYFDISLKVTILI